MSVVGQRGILTIPVIGRGDGRRSAAGRQQANVAALPGKCSPLFRKLFVYPRLRLLVGLAGGGWLSKEGVICGPSYGIAGVVTSLRLTCRGGSALMNIPRHHDRLAIDCARKAAFCWMF